MNKVGEVKNIKKQLHSWKIWIVSENWQYKLQKHDFIDNKLAGISFKSFKLVIF